MTDPEPEYYVCKSPYHNQKPSCDCGGNTGREGRQAKQEARRIRSIFRMQPTAIQLKSKVPHCGGFCLMI